MATVKVYLGHGRDTAAGLDLFADPQEGVLTTDHAASSYGLPVLVAGGQVYGPSEVPLGPLCPVYPLIPMSGSDPSLCESDESRLRRRDPEAVALVESARRAGYEVE